MLVETLLKGIAAGLVIAAPVGPVGVLCVHRTLVCGRVHGLVSGLGAAVADCLFAGVVAFGLGFVSDFLIAHQGELQLAGGSLLLMLGLNALVSRPPQPSGGPGGEDVRGLSGDCASAFVLTATNPITILSFLGVFAALGVSSSANSVEAYALVGGVFLGSAAWWLLLSAGVSVMRSMMETLYLKWMHLISGGLLLAFGVGVLAAAAF
ncbi:MAG: LysE family transporter [Alphaproteobacteria bacterium]